MKKLVLLVICLSMSGCMLKSTCKKKNAELVDLSNAMIRGTIDACMDITCNMVAEEQIRCVEAKGKIKFQLAPSCDEYLSTTTVRGLIDTKLIHGVK